MHIHYDQQFNKHITFMKRERKAVTLALKVLDELAHATHDSELRQALEIVKSRAPVAETKEDF